ncbi:MULTISPECIES: hypothetical protein [Microbacterium]|uniref:hypothetical protein n=1 Tax=Microbacterium TaxID=33882 RepID=UPI00146CEB23|nr:MULTISPECIES: hypothetical protein [Microbacterium]
MPRPQPLPEDLPEAFAVASAVSLGVSRNRLSRSDLSAPFYGVRTLHPREPEAGDVVQRCLRYAPRLKDWQFFSHETALALVGVPTPEWPHRLRLHVSAHRPAREPRTSGVVGHRLQLREPATQASLHGLPVEHPARAWRQAGTLWGFEDLVAAADFLISGPAPLASADDLRAEIRVMGDVCGGLLRAALARTRPGVRSPRETRLRLLLEDARLPEPQVNWELRDRHGRFVAELDLAFPAWLVGAEYDGRVHAHDPRQFERDADRWDRIRAEGWNHVRILNHHLRGDGAAAVSKVRDALTQAGWRPGR